MSMSERVRAGRGRARPGRAAAAPSAGLLRPLGLVLIAVVVAGASTAIQLRSRTAQALGSPLALVRVRRHARGSRSGTRSPSAERRGSGGGDRGDGRGRRCARRAAAARGNRPRRRGSGLDGGRPLAAACSVVALGAAIDGRARTRDGARRELRRRPSLATALLCALLGLIAHFLKQARASQDRTELLLAELEDAREEQTRAAAITERGRIASELHDVLAHSLSGAAIQLQGARKLAEREQASAAVRAAIDRAGELVKDGLANARQAVGALRGDELPGVAQLESLVASFRTDMNVGRHADDRRQLADAPGRRGPRPLPRRAGSAHERRALRARRGDQVVLRYDGDRTTPDRRRHASRVDAPRRARA